MQLAGAASLRPDRFQLEKQFEGRSRIGIAEVLRHGRQRVVGRREIRAAAQDGQQWASPCRCLRNRMWANVPEIAQLFDHAWVVAELLLERSTLALAGQPDQYASQCCAKAGGSGLSVRDIPQPLCATRVEQIAAVAAALVAAASKPAGSITKRPGAAQPIERRGSTKAYWGETMKTAVTVISLFALFAGLPLFGQQQRSEMPLEWFNRIDRSKDGKRSHLEIPSPQFGEFDTDGAVPAKYARLYQGLERLLDAELARQARRPESPCTKPVISVDLLAASANRGPALLLPGSIEVVRLSLDRFRELGVGSVKFAVSYPLLRPGFPRQAEYLAFYRRVVHEARQRGLKVMPHVTVLFSDTPFSPFRDLYRGLDLERFKREYREMVHLLVHELQPDYVVLLSEPDTHARLTGLRQLNTPETLSDVVAFALAGLERGRTKIGAGSGSWSPPAFAQSLAEKGNTDFISIHVYPINAPMLDHVREMARIAHARGTQVVIDEAWLYKEIRPGGGDSVAATAEVFRRDLFSFWQPLDRKFINVMLKLAEEECIGLVSFFWSGLFFSYLEYAPELDRLPYDELTRRHNRAVYTAMQEDRFSDVGRYLQRAARSVEIPRGGGERGRSEP